MVHKYRQCLDLYLSQCINDSKRLKNDFQKLNNDVEFENEVFKLKHVVFCVAFVDSFLGLKENCHNLHNSK